jgi:hypothetical protein
MECQIPRCFTSVAGTSAVGGVGPRSTAAQLTNPVSPMMSVPTGLFLDAACNLEVTASRQTAVCPD